MGRDKAFVEFNGQTLLARAVDTLKAAGLSVSVAGARADAPPQLDFYPPVIADTVPDSGPLAGICAALRSTSLRYAVFLSVDMPLLPPSLITCMLHHARTTDAAITLPSISAFAQTFPVVIRRETLPVLDRELAAGHLGCHAAFRTAAAAAKESLSVLPVEILIQTGQISHPDALPAVRWFLNVNTPRDLERAGVLHTRRVS